MSEYENLTKLAKCGGCAAKLGAGELSEVLARLPKPSDENLLVGYDTSDDACVYKLSDDLAMVQTLDFFPPVVDDAYTYGQIAAANAISDIYAMGGEPKLALNILCIPKQMPKEKVYQIMKGGYDKANEAGVMITGGHTISDEEPKYGLSVTGFVNPAKVLTNANAKIKDKLILTKHIGIGIVNTAAKSGVFEKDSYEKAVQLMVTLNKYPRDIMVKYDVSSCTDITGFSLMGHSAEMALGSGVSIIYNMEDIPLIEGVIELANKGYIPQGTYNNINHSSKYISYPKEYETILFDPQTSGGLLISVSSEDADKLLEELNNDPNVPIAKIIGEVVEFNSTRVIVK